MAGVISFGYHTRSAHIAAFVSSLVFRLFAFHMFHPFSGRRILPETTGESLATNTSHLLESNDENIQQRPSGKCCLHQRNKLTPALSQVFYPRLMQTICFTDDFIILLLLLRYTGLIF